MGVAGGDAADTRSTMQRTVLPDEVREPVVFLTREERIRKFKLDVGVESLLWHDWCVRRRAQSERASERWMGRRGRDGLVGGQARGRQGRAPPRARHIRAPTRSAATRAAPLAARRARAAASRAASTRSAS